MKSKIGKRDAGKLKEFIGFKIKIDKVEQSAKFTQPVMIQSFLVELGAGKKANETSEIKHSSEETRNW